MPDATLTKADLDALVSAANSPHVDLGPLLGLPRPLTVGLDDMIALAQQGEPSVLVSYGDASLTVKRQDGGVMATLGVSF